MKIGIGHAVKTGICVFVIRLMAVVFRGATNARIVPQPRAEDHRRTFNHVWGVERKGAMLAQRMREDWSLFTGPMRVWISQEGLSKRVEEDGWVFMEAEAAYAAVRPARSGYTWQPSEDRFDFGEWLVPGDSFSPVIIEVARNSDIPSYAAFRNAIKHRPNGWDGDDFHYRGLEGHLLVLPTDYSRLPEIDGIPINPNPPRVFESPFMQSEWDSGVVEVRKDSRRLTYDFNAKQPRRP